MSWGGVAKAYCEKVQKASGMGCLQGNWAACRGSDTVLTLEFLSLLSTCTALLPRCTARGIGLSVGDLLLTEQERE